MSRVSSSIRPWIVVVLVGFGLVVSSQAVGPSHRTEKNQTVAEVKVALDGAWRLVSSKDPRSGQLRESRLVSR